MATSVAALMRRFVVDFLSAGAPEVCTQLMAADYELTIAGSTLRGRDKSYLPAVCNLFEQFPGLCVTVHDVVVGDRSGAIFFTEHGASGRHSGALAAWAGIALLESDGERLRRGWAEEDYAGRRVQLRSGDAATIRPPHPAPWDTPAATPDAGVERLAREWLAAGAPGVEAAATLVSVDALVSTPDRFAAHATYDARGISFGLAALAHVDGGAVQEWHSVHDRDALDRAAQGGAR